MHAEIIPLNIPLPFEDVGGVWHGRVFHQPVPAYPLLLRWLQQPPAVRGVPDGGGDVRHARMPARAAGQTQSVAAGPQRRRVRLHHWGTFSNMHFAVKYERISIQLCSEVWEHIYSMY